MSYTAWSVSFGEQPSATKWNIIGANAADANTRIAALESSVTTLQALPNGVVAYVTGTTGTPVFSTASTELGTLSVGTYGYATGILLYTSVFINRGYSGSPPTFNIAVCIREDSTSGTLMSTSSATRSTAIAEGGSATMTAYYELPASTAKTFKVTAHNDSATNVQSQGGYFNALVFSRGA